VELPMAASMGKKAIAAAAGAPRVIESGMLPLFTLDKQDVNDRSHARGQFLRVYPTAAGTINVTAPERYGEWSFHQWTDKFGNPLPNASSALMVLNMNQDMAVVAQYVLPTPTPPTLQAPLLENSNIIIRWNGGDGIVLQRAASITGSWQDVSGTDGISEISTPITQGASFFRAAKR
jgi:hypothetical protein